MKRKEKKIPVVFVHTGNQEYLEYAIKSAKKFKNDVILIGDKNNYKICENHIDMETLKSEEYIEFEKIYKHMSTNESRFEILCFKRYFLLREFMVKNNIERSMMLDSDVLTFCDYSTLAFDDNYASLSMPKSQDDYRWSYSPHCSYWTLEALEDFINYTMHIYREEVHILEEKYFWHIENKKLGGICDMTLLYLWAKNKENILNTSMIINDSVIDHNIQSSENYNKKEYKYNKLIKLKRVKFDKGIPYLYNMDLNKRVKLNAIHCQGSSKKLMKNIYNGKTIAHIRFIIIIKKIIEKIMK